MTREQFISHVESTQIALRRFLVALCCGDTALADDIAQESYMKAYLSSDGFRDGAKFSSWIFRIAYNTFISHHRSFRPTADESEAMRMAADDETDAQFRYQALHKALALLPDKERTSLLLFYMQGYAIKEIADIVEVSQDAVKQHLSRGRTHLRQLLKRDEFIV